MPAVRAAEVESLRLLGQLRRDLGDTEGALEAFDRALARAGLDHEHLDARGVTLVQKASLLWRNGSYDRAVESAAEGLAIARRQGHKGHQAAALNLIGVSLASQGALEDAIACIRASIVLDRAAGDRIYVGRKCSNVGQMHGELGDTERAGRSSARSKTSRARPISSIARSVSPSSPCIWPTLLHLRPT